MNRAKILIVEDESLVAMDIEEALTGMGYTVCGKASTSEEALALCEREKPAVVLMDIVLQGGTDGIATADIVRTRFGLPVIYLTAHADTPTLERAKITAPYGYVLKPYREVELRTVIEIALFRHAQDALKAHSKPKEGGFHPESAVKNLSPAAAESAKKIAAALKDVDPFKHLSMEILYAVAAACKREEYPSGKVLAYENDEDQDAVLVLTGRIALIKSSPNGKDLILELLGPKDPYGILMVMDEGPIPFCLRAQTDVTAIRIPVDVVQFVLSENPEVGQTLVDQVLYRLRRAHDFSRALAHDRVEVRAASALINMLPKFSQGTSDGAHYELNMTRQELADLIGATPETASRIANSFEREGILDLSKPGKVIVHNKQALLSLMNEAL